MMKYKLLWKCGEEIDIPPVGSVSITADGRYIVVGGQSDGNVYLLKSERDRGELLWGYGTGDAFVESVAITPDGNYIAAGTQGADGHVNLLNREGRLLWEYNTGHGRAIVSSVAITFDGDYIAARDRNDVYLFNKEGEVLWKYEIGGAESVPLFAEVSITSDGKHIAAGGEDGNVYLLNREGVLLRTYKTGSVSRIEDVAITPEGDHIAAGCKTAVYLLNEGGAVLWDYRTGRITSNVVAKYTSVAVTSNGKYIAAATTRDYGNYKLCLLSDGKLLWQNRFNVPVLSVSMTLDGKYIVAGSSDKNVYLFQSQETINNDTQRGVNQKENPMYPKEVKGNLKSPVIPGSIEDAFSHAKFGRLDIATLNSLGFDEGTIVKFEDGSRYILERRYFGSPELVQVRELVRPRWKDTDLEKKTEEFLNELGFKEHADYEKQYPVSIYWIDFAFVNERVAVEPGADYWHPKGKDKAKEKALKERGWEILWFNEDDINHDEEGVKRKIREAVMGKRDKTL
jgi:very-short-patch-repair endonuclease/outer membrane protein assembly factor BamB